MSKKIGFWSVFAIVTGSQIGTTVFIAPVSLAPYGFFSLMGWLLSGVGAISLCLVFAGLCSRYPETGGPHAYIKNLFGPVAAFFTGWTYWIVSFVSTTVVVITAIASLNPFLGSISQFSEIVLQITLLAAITLLNLRGVQAAGKVEFILIVLKFIPLIIIPAAALFYFKESNFILAKSIKSLPTSTVLSQVTLLTFFGFIGLECATAPAGEVENPSVTIPKAIIVGTLSVASLYFLNSIGIMGMLPGSELAIAKAPYIDVSKAIFGGKWYLLVSLVASIVCIGTLNAWILASGQIVLGLAQDQLMPKVFARKNIHGAPYFGIILSSLVIAVLLVLTAQGSLSKQINAIIDISVSSFLFVYLICSLAFFKLKIQEKSLSIFNALYGCFAIIFCVWVICKTQIDTLLIALLFVLSGLPMYRFWYKRKLRHE